MPEARDFDGANDQLSFASDASIDDFVALSGSLWIVIDATATSQVLLAKGNFATDGWYFRFQATSNLRLARTFSGTDAFWTTASPGITAGVRFHVGFTHDGSTGDATIYYNGSTETPAGGPPTGTISVDAAETLLAGESNAGTFDLDGREQNICIANATWTAEQMNRARWWGKPGPVAVYHPLFTDKLANEGTATANGTATGTSVAPFVTPVVRPGTAMMGMGIGW